RLPADGGTYGRLQGQQSRAVKRGPEAECQERRRTAPEPQRRSHDRHRSQREQRNANENSCEFQTSHAQSIGAGTSATSSACKGRSTRVFVAGRTKTTVLQVDTSWHLRSNTERPDSDRSVAARVVRFAGMPGGPACFMLGALIV